MPSFEPCGYCCSKGSRHARGCKRPREEPPRHVVTSDEDWRSVYEVAPPEGVIVNTIARKDSRLGQVPLARVRGLWWTPDGKLWTRYSPLWWRPE